MQSLESWLDYIAGQHWQDIDMGLERMLTMVARMDLQRPAGKIITVAGTNGKGSTCVACEALLRAQGLTTGVTLSPHVVAFNERIRINGAEADDDLIVAAFAAVEAARDDAKAQPIPLTYFEFSALAALWCFRQCAVDVAILEIGLGGRLDAFNVIDADVAVITSIGIDHEAYLGTDRDAIGAEKAGILRTNQDVVLGSDMPPSVMARCAELQLRPLIVDHEFDMRTEDAQHWGARLRNGAVLARVPYGQCAPHNLLLAYLTASRVADVALADVVEVVQRIHMPGRMQSVDWLQRSWLLDVAHNPAGVDFLVKQLHARGIRPAAIVCGMLADKQHHAVFERLHSIYDVPWFCMSTSGERGMQARDLARALQGETEDPDVAVCEGWQALAQQVNSATLPGSVILAFGSFNLIEQFHLIDKSQHFQSKK